VADGKVAREEREYLGAVAAEMKVLPKDLEALIAGKIADRR
jgi:hypothetical protein